MADTVYTARLLMPDLIEQGRNNALSCPVYRDGALAEPTSGTVTIYDSAAAELVSGAAVTVTGSVATYTLTSATVASSDLGEGWLIEWALVMPDGVTHTFRNDCALVRRKLYPVVTDLDLFRRCSSLDPSSDTCISSLTDYQDYLDESWAEIGLKLIRQGNRPNLILSPSALRDCHLYLTLALVFEDLSTRLNEAYGEHADRYRRQWEKAWASLSFLYDEGDNGENSEPHKRRGGPATYWLSGRANG